MAQPKSRKPKSSLPNLKDLCAKWQMILRLQDWDVEVKYSRDRDFNSPGCQAECRIADTLKKAYIRIQDPVDYDSVGPQDIEQSLVHELVHLHTHGFTKELARHEGEVRKDTAEYILFEQAVEVLATAFTSLHRFTPAPVE